MRAWGRAALAAAVIVTATSTALSATAAAHVHQTANGLELTFGWHSEPAFTGSANAIDLEVADVDGTPVSGSDASVTVDLSIGDDRTQLALTATDEPGLFTAPIVPTRAGTYTFHIVGTARGKSIDVTSTCSDQTFDCVEDPTAVQFPTKEPAAGQIADRVDREAGRVDSARSSASSAHTLAVVAIVLSTLALGATVAFGVRRGRKHT